MATDTRLSVVPSDAIGFKRAVSLEGIRDGPGATGLIDEASAPPRGR